MAFNFFSSAFQLFTWEIFLNLNLVFRIEQNMFHFAVPFVAFQFHSNRIILIAIVIVLAIPIFGLTGFHMVLVARGRTTNEQVTGKFKGGYNPFSRGCWHNCCYTQFGPQYPRYEPFIYTPRIHTRRDCHTECQPRPLWAKGSQKSHQNTLQLFLTIFFAGHIVSFPLFSNLPAIQSNEATKILRLPIDKGKPNDQHHHRRRSTARRQQCHATAADDVRQRPIDPGQDVHRPRQRLWPALRRHHPLQQSNIQFGNNAVYTPQRSTPLNIFGLTLN